MMEIPGFRIGSALKKIIINAGWLFVLRAGRILFALFVGVWLARYLGPAQFGDFSFALAFVMLFTPLITLGLESIVVRDLVREPQAKDEILGTTFYLRMIGGAFSLAVIVVVIYVIRAHDPVVRLMTVIIAAGSVFQAFDTIDVWFQSVVEAKYTVYARFAALVLANGGKIALILWKAPLVAFAWVSAFETVMTGICLVAVYRMRGHRVTSWRFSLHRAWVLLSQSWTLVFAGVLALIYLKIDQVMLGEMSGREELGIYSTAVRISEVWYFVPMAISMSVFPALIKSREMGKGIYRQRLQQLYDFLVGMALVVAVPMTFAANPLVRVLFGQPYIRSGPILAVHVWAGIFVFLKVALARWLLNEGFLYFLFISNGVGAAANVFLNLLLIPKYGGMGAAIATVISYAAAGYFACFLRRETREAGWMMTLALVVPVRMALRLAGRGARGRPGG